MSREGIVFASLALLASASGGGRIVAAADERPGNAARTPEQAVGYLFAAAGAGDWKAAAVQMEATTRKLFPPTQEVRRAREKLSAAMNAKFGAEPPSAAKSPTVSDTLAHAKSVEVLDKVKTAGGRFRVRFKATLSVDGKESTVEEKVTTVKEAGVWKVAFFGPAPPKPKALEEGVEFLVKLKPVIEEKTREVESGKYATRQEAQTAFQKAIVAIAAKQP